MCIYHINCKCNDGMLIRMYIHDTMTWFFQTAVYFGF